MPDTVAGAAAVGFKIEKQPEDFGQERYELDLSGVGRLVLLIRVGAGAVILLLRWDLYRVVRWLVGI